jgi:hypothetical protein
MAHNNLIGSAAYQDAYRRRWEAEVFKAKPSDEQRAKRYQRDDPRAVLNREKHCKAWHTQVKPLLAKYPQPIRALAESTGLHYQVINQILRWAQYEGFVVKGKPTRVADNRGQLVSRPTWKLSKAGPV